MYSQHRVSGQQSPGALPFSRLPVREGIFSRGFGKEENTGEERTALADRAAGLVAEARGRDRPHQEKRKDAAPEHQALPILFFFVADFLAQPCHRRSLVFVR